METAISLDGVSKEYRMGWRRARIPAVSEVSLQVARGEAFGFIGPNGAGKSTTIKILTGLLSPSSGCASIFDIPCQRPEARQRVGYVPENPYLFDFMTPLEILAMSMELNAYRPKNARQASMTWLERFELAQVANRPIRSFSKGMTQRVALAQSLCFEPRLLILDEPLSGLDPIGRRDVVELLAAYKKAGGTLFFTSHVLHDVERLADRFGLIHRGKITAVRSPAELVGGEDMVQVRSQGECAVAGAVQEFPGRWSAAVPRSALWPYLQALQAQGHVLVEARPTLTLESAFMQAIASTDTPDASGLADGVASAV